MVAIDNGIFKLRSHIPSMDYRKSRNNSFSICNHLCSYLYSDDVFAGLRLRSFGIDGNVFFRDQLNSLLRTKLSLDPK